MAMSPSSLRVTVMYHSPMPDRAPKTAQVSDAIRLTAFHEAGHAVMAELCGRQVTEVEIVGDPEHTGSVHSLAFPPDPGEGDTSDAEIEDIERQLKIVLSGEVAEAMVTGREEWDETNKDLDAAVRLAMRMVDDCEEVLPLLSEIRSEVERGLRAHWPAVEALVHELIERKSLTGTEVRRLLTRVTG
jgi:ATP-dependent Zn protease